MEDLHFDQSESDEDISPRKKVPNLVSYDSDLESYDVSSRHGKEPASGRPFTRKEIPSKMPPSFPTRAQQKQNGIVWFTEI